MMHSRWYATRTGEILVVSFSSIGIERRRHCATITLSRPDKLNPIDWTTLTELLTAIGEIEADPDTRFVVLTGAGQAFSAGGDLEKYVDLYRNPPEFRLFLEDFFQLCDTIERSRRIFIAAVNGPCVAGGLELLLACDLAIAADTARIGDGHINFAQLPGAGGSQRLPRAIGVARAKQLMLSGRLLDGQEAQRIGLVAEAVPAERLMARVDEIVDALSERSAYCVAGMKYLLNEGMRGSLQSGLRLEVDYVHNYATVHPDATEGLVAFGEKRAPRFSET
jgi:enoyl-CoA hydratase